VAAVVLLFLGVDHRLVGMAARCISLLAQETAVAAEMQS
jgi:hypothetical protein